MVLLQWKSVEIGDALLYLLFGSVKTCHHRRGRVELVPKLNYNSIKNLQKL
jgi:hypothetical protein